MSKIFTFYKWTANGPADEKNAVEINVGYFAYFGGLGNFDKANIKAFKLYMGMTNSENQYDLVSEEIGAKDKKKGIVYKKWIEYIDAHDRSAWFFLTLLHRMVWQKKYDPAIYNDRGHVTGINWLVAAQWSMDIEDAIWLLKKLIEYYITIEDHLIEMKYGAALNAAVVNNKLDEIKEKAKFNLGTFNK